MVSDKVVETIERSKELMFRQNFNRAIRLLDESLNQTREEEELALLHLAKGLVQYFRHRPYDALKELREALRYAENAKKSELTYEISESILYIEDYIDLIEKSIEDEERVIEEEVDDINRAIHLNELGTLYYYLGKIESAEENFERALEIFAEAGENIAVAATLLNLGNIKEGIEALDCFYTALDILEREGHLTGIADTYESIALFYWRDEKWEEAYYFFKKEIEIIEEIKNKEGNIEIISKYEDVYRMAADLAITLGKEDEALKWIEKMKT